MEVTAEFMRLFLRNLYVSDKLSPVPHPTNGRGKR